MSRKKPSVLSSLFGRGPALRVADCPRHNDARECEELADALGSRTTSRIRLEHAIGEEIWATAVRALGLEVFEPWMRQWEIGDCWRHEAPWPSLASSVALHHLPIASAKSASRLFLDSGGTRAWCRMQEEWVRAQGDARISLYRVIGERRLEDAYAGTLVDLMSPPAGFLAKPGEVVLARPLVYRGESLLLPWDLDGHALSGDAAANAIAEGARCNPPKIFEAWYAAIGDEFELLQ